MHPRIDMTVIRRGGQPDVPFMRSLLVHAYNWHVNRFDTDVPIDSSDFETAPVAAASGDDDIPF